MVEAPSLTIGSFCTLQDAKTKAPIRHVLIRDLEKVAAATKQPWHLKDPTALLHAFDGDPAAAEHCAKNLHSRLLRRLKRAEPKTVITALSSAILDLDAELRDQRPGAPGCSGVAALFVGCHVFVVVAGNCVGMLWGKGLATAAAASNSSSEIGKDGVLRRSSHETPEQKRAKALMRLRARVPTQQIGGSVALPGGKRPGSHVVAAAGAAAVKAQSVAAATGGKVPGTEKLRLEDLLSEVVQLKEGDHSLAILGTAGLFASGFTPQDIGAIAEACAPDAMKTSQVLSEQAKERLKEACKGEANWVQQEQSKTFEVATLAVQLCWEGVGEPEAKKPRLE